MQKHTEPHFLSVAEVGARLSFHPTTVRKMIHTGELPATMLRGTLRVRVADLEAYINAAAVTPSKTEE
ncbi:MAG: helix-turn-helix domain-containing protein [Dehalococcoidia bacterium]